MAGRSFRIRLSDIREEIAGIKALTKDADAESFAASWAMKRAIEHALLIIAEAAKHIPDDVKQHALKCRGRRCTALATCCGTNTAGSIPTFYGRS